MLVVQFLELAGLIPALLFRRLPTTEFVPAPYADERSSLLEWPNGAPATTGVNAGEQHSEHHTKPAVLIQSQGWGSIPYTPLLFTAICLLALITPPSVAPFSFNVYPLPSPHNDDTILSLACIMPEFDPSTSKRGVFEAYRAESASINGQAKIHLWPEGAVRWDTAQERAADIQTLQNSIKVNSGYVIALGFEDFAPRKSDEREGIRRNGIMVISAEGVEFEYLKQNLVPITESFSMIHSTKPPPFHTLHIPYKKTGKNWRTRPVVITAAICLDFAHPSTLLLAEPDDPNEKSPPRRADVVLAPGKTWDVRIGEMMHEQVALRADEVGSIGLWCDRGGISGVVGRGESGAQRGVQTFMHTISIPYDPEEKVQPHHATFYARMGDMVSVLLIWVPFIGALLFPKLGIELGHPGGLQGEVNGNEHQPAIISGALLAVQRASAPVIAGGSASSHAIRAAIGNATAFVQRRFARNQPPAGNLIDF
ncbi:hypothetical protein DL93DRAFT_2074203 [Clavulina sp. PMI_390]|nr:hypothetical protein DL93DRAFT_2074203 [Clavulina sp. PMI_390]